MISATYQGNLDVHVSSSFQQQSGCFVVPAGNRSM
jgi:hypothetical protein